ncbi:transposase [Orenia metallireducens]|uniref:transposase n=1 Tax=Orenia metallireducens TaxID=1413210 RepID=UPI002481090E|nr:transposase [Orenia metallireducens]
MDSSTVSLGLSLFSWAKFRSSKGGIKLHTVYDLNVQTPENVIITNAIIHDKEIFDNLTLSPSVTYLFDRAYIHYQKFDDFIENDIYFITRTRSNTKIEFIRSIDLTSRDKEVNILLDADVMLGDYTLKTKMKHEMRLVRVKNTNKNGTKEIAVLIQIYSALILFLILKVIKKEAKFKDTLLKLI